MSAPNYIGRLCENKMSSILGGKSSVIDRPVLQIAVESPSHLSIRGCMCGWQVQLHDPSLTRFTPQRFRGDYRTPHKVLYNCSVYLLTNLMQVLALLIVIASNRVQAYNGGQGAPPIKSREKIPGQRY